jgi:hypothetical protein
LAVGTLKSHAELALTYEGPAVDSGVMDVRDLAPALLSLGNLIEAANRVVNGENSTAQIQVRTVGAGSFSIGFDVTVAFLQSIRDLLAGAEATAAANVITILTGGAAVGGGAVALVKWLKGRTPTAIKRKEAGRVLVEVDGQTIEVDEIVARVSVDVSVRLALERVVAEPLSREGIDAVIIGEKSSPERIEKPDGYSFLAPPDRESGSYEYRYRAPFSIVSLSFKQGNKWRLNDGKTTLNVTVVDQAYLERVDRNEITFAKGDILICDVRVETREEPKGLKAEFFIERVVEQRRPGRQASLFDPPETNGDPKT